MLFQVIKRGYLIRLKNIIFILINTYSFSQVTEIIPYDWVGQFGLIKNNGVILHNSDWRSNKLFFDGTWSIYPKLYGHYIENQFTTNDRLDLHQKKRDTAQVSSEFIYDQGDYLFDQFSFQIKQVNKKKHIQLNGFKRSFSGDNNQYENNSTQPIQQSYTISYESKYQQEYGGISVGHFFTYSGIPDIHGISLYSNKITTSNAFWEHSYENFKYIISIDNFLQKFKSNHSSSLNQNARSLTRSVYQGEVALSNLGDLMLSFGISTNNRDIKQGYNQNTNWNNYFLNSSYKDFGSFFEIMNFNKNSFFNYTFEFENNFGSLDIYLSHKNINKQVHPFFTFIEDLNPAELVSNEIYSTSIFKWNFRNGYFSSMISRAEDKNKMWEKIYSESDLHLISQTIYNEFNTTFIPKIDLALFYNYQQKESSYQSGNVGDWFGMRIKSNLLMFNGFMNLDFMTEFKRFEERAITFYLNPVEKIPIYNNSLGKIKSSDMINTSITVSVSSFKIKYEWNNILQLINNNELYEISFHPEIPSMGMQKNISIEWHFLD